MSINKVSTQLTCAEAFTIWYPRLLHKNIMSRNFFFMSWVHVRSSCITERKKKCLILAEHCKNFLRVKHLINMVIGKLRQTERFKFRKKRETFIFMTHLDKVLCLRMFWPNTDIALPNAHSGAQLRKFSARLLHQSRLNVPRFSPWTLLTAHCVSEFKFEYSSFQSHNIDVIDAP